MTQIEVCVSQCWSADLRPQQRHCPQVCVQVSQLSGTLPVQLQLDLSLQHLIGRFQTVDLHPPIRGENKPVS